PSTPSTRSAPSWRSRSSSGRSCRGTSAVGGASRRSRRRARRPPPASRGGTPPSRPAATARARGSPGGRGVTPGPGGPARPGRVWVRTGLVGLRVDLGGDRGLTYLFITHDLAIAWVLADRIAVMYLGKLMEIGPAEQVIRTPKNPYTQALVSVSPSTDPPEPD